VGYDEADAVDDPIPLSDDDEDGGSGGVRAAPPGRRAGSPSAAAVAAALARARSGSYASTPTSVADAAPGSFSRAARGGPPSSQGQQQQRRAAGRAAIKAALADAFATTAGPGGRAPGRGPFDGLQEEDSFDGGWLRRPEPGAGWRVRAAGARAVYAHNGLPRRWRAPEHHASSMSPCPCTPMHTPCTPHAGHPCSQPPPPCDPPAHSSWSTPSSLCPGAWCSRCRGWSTSGSCCGGPSAAQSGARADWLCGVGGRGWAPGRGMRLPGASCLRAPALVLTAHNAQLPAVPQVVRRPA
jgi:hypothetical protein